MTDCSMKQPAMIALLGAESTGKTALSLSLAQHLRASGRVVMVVPEVLREWCDQAGRTPFPYEQRTVAEEQARRALAAAARPEVEIVIVDTTPLMTAIYSERLFQDSSLYEFALTHHRIYHQTLVMGLDLPWVPDGLQRDSPAVQAPVDTMIRHTLAKAHIAFQVIYGAGPERLHHALRTTALGTIGGSEESPTMIPEKATTSIANSGIATVKNAERPPQNTRHPTRWVWACDKCSDPDCEHWLFARALFDRG